jgi:hypothetical protein
MATLLRLQAEVNAKTTTGTGLKLTFVGATESYLLAKEIAAADVGVIITPPRSFPYNWERRRMYVLNLLSLPALFQIEKWITDA